MYTNFLIQTKRDYEVKWRDWQPAVSQQSWDFDPNETDFRKPDLLPSREVIFVSLLQGLSE